MSKYFISGIALVLLGCSSSTPPPDAAQGDASDGGAGMTSITETGGSAGEAGRVADTTIDVEADVTLDVPSDTGETIDGTDGGIDVAESVDGETMDSAPDGGAAAVLAIDKASVDFGKFVVGTTAPDARIVLSNKGPGDVPGIRLTLSSTSHITLTTTGCKGALPEGASCTLSIFAEAVGVGSFTGSVAIVDLSGRGPPVTISVAGEVVPTDYGAIWVEPSGAAFAVNVGETSPAIAFRLPRTQLAAGFALTFATGAGGDFHVVDNGCASVPADTSCTFSVAFSPLAKVAGSRSDILTVSGTGAASGNTGWVMLSGTVWPESPFVITPAVADFGSVAHDTTGPATILTVTNNGDIDSSPLAVSVSGSSFVISQDNCTGHTIAKATSCTFGLALKPVGTGATSAILAAHDDRADLPVVRTVVGQGI